MVAKDDNQDGGNSDKDKKQNLKDEANKEQAEDDQKDKIHEQIDEVCVLTWSTDFFCFFCLMSPLLKVLLIKGNKMTKDNKAFMHGQYSYTMLAVGVTIQHVACS